MQEGSSSPISGTMTCGCRGISSCSWPRSRSAPPGLNTARIPMASEWLTVGSCRSTLATNPSCTLTSPGSTRKAIGYHPPRRCTGRGPCERRAGGEPLPRRECSIPRLTSVLGSRDQRGLRGSSRPSHPSSCRRPTGKTYTGRDRVGNRERGSGASGPRPIPKQRYLPCAVSPARGPRSKTMP